jgi:hypothetical protein
MRYLVVLVVLPLLAAGFCACDCDCMQHVAEKDKQIVELQGKVTELEQKVTELEGAATATEAPAASKPGGPSPATLGACLERLKACEQDPFKGPKYFSPEKVEPDKGGGKKVPADLIDPFAGKDKPPPAKGAIVDPFAGK